MSAAIPVTADNFRRAGTGRTFGGVIQQNGGVGKVLHHRAPLGLDHKPRSPRSESQRTESGDRYEQQS